MTQNEIDMFNAINQQRINNGVPALVGFSTCTCVSQEHSKKMYDCSFCGHDWPACNGQPAETFQQRLYRWHIGGAAGENAACGYGSISQAVNGWMNSPGHRANILNSNFRGTGLGYYNGYWTQCFSSQTD